MGFSIQSTFNINQNLISVTKFNARKNSTGNTSHAQNDKNQFFYNRTDYNRKIFLKEN